MYDFTNAGPTNIGGGIVLDLYGGKNYVADIMEKTGAKLGEITNVAAFNTKENADGFIKNAIEGNANLFAPHAGTKEGSWQFQQNIFEQLVEKLLDNNVITNEELIKSFNSGLKSKDGKKGLRIFNKAYSKAQDEKGSNLPKLKNTNNLNDFIENPKKLVELLDIDNNYSPDLRKVLNDKIASNQKVKDFLGIKNKTQFAELLEDPMNVGSKPFDLMGVIEFDNTTFEDPSRPKKGDADYHPSFAWTVKAKIKAIVQPTYFYQSTDVTDSYTKFNKDGVVVSRKTDVKDSKGKSLEKLYKIALKDTRKYKTNKQGKKVIASGKAPFNGTFEDFQKSKFKSSNVSSSAGSIPKIATVKAEIKKDTPQSREQRTYPLENISGWYGDADYKSRGGKLVYMTPDEFLSKAKPLKIDEDTKENIDDLVSHIKEGRKLDPLTLYSLDKTDVRSSDGRHRAYAAKELNINSVPVVDFTTPQSRKQRTKSDILKTLKEGQKLPTKPKQIKNKNGSITSGKVHLYHSTNGVENLNDILENGIDFEKQKAVGGLFFSKLGSPYRQDDSFVVIETDIENIPFNQRTEGQEVALGQLSDYKIVHSSRMSPRELETLSSLEMILNRETNGGVEGYEKSLQNYKKRNKNSELIKYLEDAPQSREQQDAPQSRKQKLAPNGKRSNLNDEQYDIVRTPAFKKWFGDWENDAKNASKVVDENGEPLVTYHGSAADFDVFSKEKLGSLTNTEIAKAGFFFASNKAAADQYAFIGGLQNPYLENKLTEARAFFINIKNPYKGTNKEWKDLLNWASDGSRKYDSPTALKKANKEFKESLLEDNFDGVDFDNGLEIVAFEPNQIKLADGSNKTFDPDAPSIREQKSIEEIINDGRQNNFRESAIRDFLVRVLKKPAKEVDKLMSLDKEFLEVVPKSFTNIKGGIKAGTKLYKRVEAFRKKLVKKNDKLKGNKKLNKTQIVDKTIEYLQKQPEYINEGDKYTVGNKKKGTQETRTRKGFSTQQARMLADYTKTAGVRPTNNMNSKIRNAKAAITQKIKGARDLQKQKTILRNFIRQSLPKELYTKSEVVRLINTINDVKKDNIENLMQEVIDFVNEINVKSLQAQIKSILNNKYQKVENGIVKPIKISDDIKKRIAFIKSNMLSSKATPEEISAALIELNKRFNELAAEIEQTEEMRSEMVNISLAMK